MTFEDFVNLVNQELAKTPSRLVAYACGCCQIAVLNNIHNDATIEIEYINNGDDRIIYKNTNASDTDRERLCEMTIQEAWDYIK